MLLFAQVPRWICQIFNERRPPVASTVYFFILTRKPLILPETSCRHKNTLQTDSARQTQAEFCFALLTSNLDADILHSPSFLSAFHCSTPDLSGCFGPFRRRSPRMPSRPLRNRSRGSSSTCTVLEETWPVEQLLPGLEVPLNLLGWLGRRFLSSSGLQTCSQHVLLILQ